MRKLKTIEMNRLTADEFREADKIPLVVVLDNVRSQHNVGAVFRTADAFRLQGVVLCGLCSTPPNAEIHKTALGAELTVAWNYVADTLEAVQQLQQQGFTVFSIEQAEGSTRLQDVKLNPNEKYAIVLGHEVFGVQQTVIDASNGCIEIPQYGTKHSLNVSVTAGIVMYELSQQLLK
ncbi:MAG: RNA methyltransferase [Paludibacter sp.]|nr:RNA methyltransferase [Bacteroidales bacterium]MCM1069458.1 RNA methyltransferase [Prevotella sp.]MCM1353832.1 RNA methyltransferase [Bacteroides sp.]MCM1442768.1 RNA methyltransferase [Muribaculum sp.]MCM1481868.1 RNA methyltransferase [Paludibacter sp.]